MDSETVRQTFVQLRTNINAVDNQIGDMLTCIGGRLQLSTDKPTWAQAVALTRLKRELRNWNITQNKWMSRGAE